MDTSMNPTDSTRAESPRPETSELAAAPVAQSPKRIYRDPKGPLGGVAGGFAGYFDIDPVIVRLLWLVALLSGIGLPAYILCWLVIPKAKSWPPAGYQGRPSAAGGEHRVALLSGFAVIALAAAIGAGVTDGIGEYLLPAALVGLGVYLLNQRARTTDEAGATAATASPVGESELVGYVETNGEPSSARAGRTGLVTPTVISLLAIGTGAALALHAAGLLPLSVTAISAGGLVLVGGGLIASLWLGRARGLVPLGLGLATVMLGAATLGPWVDRVRETPIESGSVGSDPKKDVGDRFIMPQSLSDLQPSYGLGAGKLELDLTALDFTGETRQLELTVGAGEATLLVPPGVSVVVQENVGVGKAEAFGSASEGVGVRLEKRDAGTGAGTLSVELNVGLGHGQVQRAEF
jgi:phage shock protein PspC (stress-responsive transcriptional regulator)